MAARSQPLPIPIRNITQRSRTPADTHTCACVHVCVCVRASTHVLLKCAWAQGRALCYFSSND
eukprot:7521478-Alexandrium_andersonii.AAC.1